MRITKTGMRAISLAVFLLAGRASAQTAQTPQVGQVVVATTPPGAHITLDGAPAGVTPTTVKNLFPGQHLVEVSWSDGGTASALVEVTGFASKLITLSPGMKLETAPAPAPMAPAAEPARGVVNPAVAAPAVDEPVSKPRSSGGSRPAGIALTIGGIVVAVVSTGLIGIGVAAGRDGAGLLISGAVLLPILALPAIIIGSVLWAKGSPKARAAVAARLSTTDGFAIHF